MILPMLLIILSNVCEKVYSIAGIVISKILTCKLIFQSFKKDWQCVIFCPFNLSGLYSPQLAAEQGAGACPGVHTLDWM